MKTRRLILLRHAKSAWPEGAQSDHSRPLNKRGKKDAPRVAAKIADLGWSPDVVISSDSTRTQETWEHMKKAFKGKRKVKFTRNLYHAGLGAIRDAAAGLDGEVKTLMVIGHNPGWEDALSTLVGDQHAMTTCNAALLSVKADSWDEALAQAKWKLKHLLRPKEL